MKLSRKELYVALYASVVVFMAYASIYSYRKSFTAATFDDIRLWGMSYQSLLIIFQVFGYMLSKFAGIRFIAGMRRVARWKISAVLVGTSWLCLLLFAVLPYQLGLLCMFTNGFVLGFMWGVTFSYIEGRRSTDFIGVMLAVSFVFAGGFTRSVGKWLMVNWSVPEMWMPFFTGLIFSVPLAILIYLMEKIPPPQPVDVEERSERVPMTKSDRKELLKIFGLGLTIVTITYLFLTIMRDIRDNYMANMWAELGYKNNYSVFTRTETITSIIIIIMMGLLVFFRNNRTAFRMVHVPIAGGFIVAGVASLLFVTDNLSGALWMQLAGLGLYMAYIPFNCIFFERMIALFKIKGNIGFFMYLADSFGYLGSVAVIFSKEIFQFNTNWSSFYSSSVIIFSAIGFAGTVFSYLYFRKKSLSLK